MEKPRKNEVLSEAETEARREAALKQMFVTPHKPRAASRRPKQPPSAES